MSKYKQISEQLTVGVALERGADIIRELAEEMGNWRDNMSGTGLESTSKFEQVSEAADTLEQFDYDGSELPEASSAMEFTVYLTEPRSKRQSSSRAVRLGNAVAMMSGAAGALQDHISALEQEATDLGDEAGDGENPETYDRKQEIEEQVSELEQAIQSIEDAVGEIESVEFPGMFG